MFNQNRLSSKLNNANISRLKFMFTNTEDGHLYQATEKTKKKLAPVDLTQEEHDRLMEWVVKVGNTFLTNPDVYEHPISMDRFRICVYPKSRRVIADVVGGTRQYSAIISSWDSLFMPCPSLVRSLQTSPEPLKTSGFRDLLKHIQDMVNEFSKENPPAFSSRINIPKDTLPDLCLSPKPNTAFEKPMHQIAAALASDHKE